VYKLEKTIVEKARKLPKGHKGYSRKTRTGKISQVKEKPYPKIPKHLVDFFNRAYDLDKVTPEQLKELIELHSKNPHPKKESLPSNDLLHRDSEGNATGTDIIQVKKEPFEIGDKVITDAKEQGKIIAVGNIGDLISQGHDSDGTAGEATKYGDYTTKEPGAVIKIAKETFVLPLFKLNKV